MSTDSPLATARPATLAPAGHGDGRPLLAVEDLLVRFRTHEGTVHALNGVSFELAETETLGLVGESGCGKSVTSLAIMRLLPKPAGRIEGGRIVFDGQDLLALGDAEIRELRGRDLAMIFQDPMTSLNPVLTIEEQMVETIRAHRRVSVEEARKRAIELLGMVGIPHPETRLRSYAHQYSGGMRQRVMIAMALALEPKLLIADEPTTALDVTIQAQVLELLRELTANSRTAAILITHDLGVVAGMTQRTNVMYAGYIVETATTPEIFANPHHPYTVGLLHSIPRLDQAQNEPLIPIEGAPPDQRRPPVGCPFAPRCAWRLEICWQEMPPLAPIARAATAGRVVTTGPEATHRAACHNQPTPAEAEAGRPLREGFVPAPPPGAVVEELAAAAAGEEAFAEEELVVFTDEGEPTTAAGEARGLPLPPEEGLDGER
ncbi:MAG TPA: ABC transporter ATP-binding protein [Candidatus Limnocylindrales bacterium]|nr:ABC transporter ATP-binding protein [Candidatus Limnocylindrales bacterium]